MSRRLITAIAAVSATLLGATGLPPVVDMRVAAAASECTIKWSGIAGTPDWHDKANWNLERLPDASDVVCIEDGFSVAHLSGTTLVTEINVNGRLDVVGGTLSVTGASEVRELGITGGALSPALPPFWVD